MKNGKFPVASLHDYIELSSKKEELDKNAQAYGYKDALDQTL